MVIGHVVHRFEKGETQHKDLILAYTLHEQQLQVLPFDDSSKLSRTLQTRRGTFTPEGLGSPNFRWTVLNTSAPGRGLKMYSIRFNAAQNRMVRLFGR